MKATNRISVVMCTFNGSRYLAEQLESICAQTLQPGELVVCDDASTDDTLSIIEAFSQTASFPVRVHSNRVRLGSTRNFEQAIECAEGELIALCDQDDRWKPEKLEKLAQLFEDKKIAGVFTDADLIDDAGNLMEGTLWSRGHLNGTELRRFRRDPLSLLLKQNIATGATMMFRSIVRTVYREIPCEWVHDGWLAWMLALYSSPIGRLEASPLRLTEYRVHGEQQTRREAARAGSRTEPIATRLEKARILGHAHHREFANRLSLILDHWNQSGHDSNDATSHRLMQAIAFLGNRSALPEPGLLRILRILSMLPSYIQYGHGLASAGRDTFA